jgi:regulatory protein
MQLQGAVAASADGRAEPWLMSWLARREYSACEASRRLRRKGVSPERVESVIEKFTSEGLISDVRFAQSLVRARVSRGKGPLLVKAELQRQGVDPEIVRAAMSGFEWREIGNAAKIKRFGEGFPVDGDEFNRQARFLAGRGFPMDVIFSVLGR